MVRVVACSSGLVQKFIAPNPKPPNDCRGVMGFESEMGYRTGPKGGNRISETSRD